MLAIAAIVAAPWLFLSGLARRWITRPPNELVLLVLLACWLSVTMLNWILNLHNI